MRTWTFDLLFLKPSKDDLPGPAVSHLYVKTHSQKKYKGVSNNLLLIGAECMSIYEMEQEIDRLKRELEAIRKTARQKYTAHKAKKGTSN